MFTNIVKDLYIGKSKLIIKCNQKELPQTTLVMDVLRPTGFTGNLLATGEFEITPMMPKHRLYVTGIPKGAILDNFRIRRVYWSSYYEDNIRGYLFQITDEYPKLIIAK